MMLMALPILGVATATGLYYLRFYIKGNLCHLKDRIDGKVVLITGSNTGIGFETAVELAKRGGIVHMTCRSTDKCTETKRGVLERSGVDESKVFTHILDLASIKSILSFINNFKQSVNKLDILINNAGVMACPYMETEDGFEMQIGVNHLGHFLLTNELIEVLKAADKARIIIVSSRAHLKATLNSIDINLRGENYGRLSAYSQSKLANILHAKYLAKHLHEHGIAVVSLHPGVIMTDLGRHFPGIEYMKYGTFIFQHLLRTPYEGSQTSVFCAVDPDLYKHSGKYFSDCQPVESSNPLVNDEGLAEKLWRDSVNLINSKRKLIKSD